jgi:hypothetical protein
MIYIIRAFDLIHIDKMNEAIAGKVKKGENSKLCFLE